MQDLEDYSFTLKRSMDRKTSALKLLEQRYAESLRLLSPSGRIRDRLLRMDQYQDTLQGLMDRKLTNLRHRLDIDIEKMKGLSPLDRLKGGYSYAVDEKGENIRSIQKVKEGDKFSLYVSDGVIKAEVKKAENVDMY